MRETLGACRAQFRHKEMGEAAPRPRGWRPWGGALVGCLVLLVSNCAHYDVSLFDSRDAGEAGLDANGGPVEASSLDAQTDAACLLAAEPSCARSGGSCQDNKDCCTGLCDHGTCLANATCTRANMPCASRTECCSGRCEPQTTGELACTETCRPVGASCSTAADCCSTGCHGGVCTEVGCYRDDASCTTGADCCLGYCTTGGRCEEFRDPVCRPTGERCERDDECCGLCNKTLGRCDLGPGPCREPDSPCIQPTDCCRGTCTGGRCVAPCMSDGSTCAVAGDCCSGLCQGDPGVCEPQGRLCLEAGKRCESPDVCCGGTCLLGVCSPACGPTP